MGCDSGLLGVQSPNNLHSPDQQNLSFRLMLLHWECSYYAQVAGLHDTWLAVLHDVTVYNRDVSNSIQIQ